MLFGNQQNVKAQKSIKLTKYFRKSNKLVSFYCSLNNRMTQK